MVAPGKRSRLSVFDQITGRGQGMAVDFVVFLQQMALGIEPADARLSAFRQGSPIPNDNGINFTILDHQVLAWGG